MASLSLASTSCDEAKDDGVVDAGRDKDASELDANDLDASEMDASGLDASGMDVVEQPAPFCDTVTASWTLRPAETMSIPRAEDEALADAFAGAVTVEAAALQAALGVTGCEGRPAIDRARAMLDLGDSVGCLAFVMSCVDVAAPLDGALSRLAFYGAQCAAEEGKNELARELFDRATDPALADDCGDRAGRVFSYAAFVIGLGDMTGVDAIFARAPAIDNAMTRDAIAFFLGSGGTFEAFRAFVGSSFEKGDHVLAETVLAMWLDLLYQYSLDVETRAVIADNREAIEENGAVFDLLPYLYLAFYASSGGVDFSLADQVYRPYGQAATLTSWLPSEFNVYTYTEQYQTVCADGLTQGAARTRYEDLLSDWRSGSITDAAALDEAETILGASGEAADVLTFMGSLLDRTGATDEALDHFIRAHRACIYYNRSHWALQQVRRWIRIQQRDDYPDQVTERAEVLAQLGDVPALASYATNLASLSPDQVDGLKYALRFWVPYLGALAATGSSIYVKHSFELLSDVPGWESIRDTRIDYPGDYRLWDDVRGVGGNPVAVDVNEMMFNPYGDYNLAAHEVAHQVEDMAPADFAACVMTLYEAALARDLFVNYYSSVNQSEYFAEGVVTYLIEPDAPPYFGRNRSWLVENDPDLLAWVEQLAAGTPLDAALCP